MEVAKITSMQSKKNTISAVKHIVGEQRDGVGSDQADQADPGFNGQKHTGLSACFSLWKQLDRINPVDLNQ